MRFDPAHALRLAQETLDIEAQALARVRQRLGEPFGRAVALMLDVQGRVVVMGMGKSGHIGRKIAATLASTGTPAMFVHPAEASHGDLGMIKPVDAVLAISNSGESDELTAILPLVKRLGAPLVAITGGAGSTLARHADVVLDSSVEKEACPLNLAPTASTTAQLALGRRLLTRVADIMRTGDQVPRVTAGTGFSALMQEMTRKGLGATAVLDERGALLGIFTDGDLRRLVETGGDLRALTAREVMHAGPRTVDEQALAAEAADLMEKHRINVLLVTNAAGALVGALSANDLMRAKVI